MNSDPFLGVHIKKYINIKSIHKLITHMQVTHHFC